MYHLNDNGVLLYTYIYSSFCRFSYMYKDDNKNIAYEMHHIWNKPFFIVTYLYSIYIQFMLEPDMLDSA